MRILVALIFVTVYSIMSALIGFEAVVITALATIVSFIIVKDKN